MAQRDGNKRVAGEECQLWKLTVNPDHSATLTSEDGNGNAVCSKAIEFTDFPLPDHAVFHRQHDLAAERVLSRPGAAMAKPDTLIVDGHAFSWQRLCELRRQQLEAWKAAQPSQPALFELKDD